MNPSGPCPSCGSPLNAGVCPRCATQPGVLPRLPEAGELFAGRYRIGAILGRGGMGVVYRAQDLILKEPVAIKIIRPELLNRPQVLARFVREVTLARKLAHPNICRIHDLGEARGLRYISMQLVEGTSLEQRLRSAGPLPAGEVRHITRRLLSALEEAHARGVVHRDIKPKNIVVDPDGEPVLMDFGIAKDLSPGASGEVSTLAGVSVGTPAYMSPEVAQGGTARPASDLYSLGITVYKLVTGKLPFEGESSYEILKKQVEARVPAVEQERSDLPADLLAFIRGALEKDLGRRFASAAEARGVFAGTGAEAPRPTHAGPGRARPGLRGRLLAASALAALGLALVLLRVLRDEAPESAPGRVAVLAFREAPDLGELGGAGSIVADMLITSFGRMATLEVVSRLKIEQLAGGAAGAPPALEVLSREAGASRVVTGSLARGGGRLRLEAQLIDAVSGRVLGSFARESADGGGLFDLVDPLAEDLAEALGVPAPPTSVTGVTTASLPAYRAYDRGLLAFGRFELDRARVELSAAVAEDPGFALAWSRLASVNELAGRRADAVEASRRALALADRLGSAERELVRGTARLLERRWDLARGHLQRYLRRHPDDAFVLQALAECEIGRHAWDAAIELLERNIASERRLAVAWERLGSAYLARRLYEPALRRFEELGRQLPRSPLPWVGLGRVQLARHRVVEADAAFLAALERSPGFLPALVGRGDAALARHDHDAALRFYREAAAKGPEAPEPIAGEARVALATRRLEEARAQFERLLARDPQSREGLTGVGRVNQAEHAYDEARSWYERALEVDPYLVDAHLALSVLALEERRFADALTELDRAEAIDGHALGVVLQRGQVFRQQRRFDEARAAAQLARERDPYEPEALNLLGLIEDDLHDFASASSWYEKAVALDSFYTYAMNNLGVAKARAGEHEAARRWLVRAAEASPFEAVSFANLGLLAGLSGDETSAWAMLERAGSVDPGSVDLQLAHSGVARALGRAEEALVVLARASKLNPRDERVPCERGRALRELRRPAEATQAFAAALELNPRMLEAALGLGALHLERGAVDAARRLFEPIVSASDGPGAVRVARVYQEGGRPEEARAWTTRALAADPANPWVAYDAAQAMAEAGSPAEALRLLGLAVERGFRETRVLLADPAFEGLRGDPAYVALVGRLGTRP